MAEKLVRYLTFRLSDEAVLAKETPLDFKGLIAGSKGYLKVKVLARDSFSNYAAAVVYAVGEKTYPVPLKKLACGSAKCCFCGQTFYRTCGAAKGYAANLYQ